MALAVVLVIALTQALTLVALDDLAVVLVITMTQALTLVALDGPGRSVIPSPDPRIDTSSPRWHWL